MSISVSAKQIIPYYGGKSGMADKLISWFPENANQSYIELFSGGLAIFFRKKKAEWNCVNDKDSDLINLYTICADKDLFEMFAQRTFWITHSRAIYEEARKLMKFNLDKSRIPDIDRAAMYYFWIKTSFNNRPGTALSKEMNAWSLDLLEELRYSRRKLEGVLIENMDFEELLEKYKNKQNLFVYADPPYWVANDTQYYRNVFGREDHIRMLKAFLRLHEKGVKFMISYDAHPEVIKVYEEQTPFFQRTFDYVYGSSNDSKKSSELVITNYKIADQRNLFDVGSHNE